MARMNILDFGAVPCPRDLNKEALFDSEIADIPDNASAIQKAVDACAASGGGTVLIPAGKTFMAGPFHLRSNTNLHLEQGSWLVASPVERVYTESAFKQNRAEGSMWISAKDCRNIAITGLGGLNGNGPAFMGEERKAAFDLKPITTVDPRPHLLTLINCANVSMHDLTFKNSAYWCVHLVGCQDVVIHGIRIKNHLKIRNSDGIDVDHSKDVHISGCSIESGDDCICLKNRREYEEYGDCENITVSDCVMVSTSCSFKIGSENVNAIRNVVVNNCIIQKSNRGIGIQNRDEGIVEGVLFSNISIEGRLFNDVWWGKAEPIYITAFRRAAANTRDANWRFAPGQIEGKVGPVRNIRFTNCVCRSENGVYVSGEDGLVSGIRFENVAITLQKVSNFEGGWYDRRPCAVQGLLKSDIYGFYIDTAEDVQLRDIQITLMPYLPDYYKESLFFAHVGDVNISSLRLTRES